MQFNPIKVVDIELSDPIKHITGLEGYGKLKALVRHHGSPVGWIAVPVNGDCCFAEEIRRKILDLLSNEIVDHLLRQGLMKPIGPEGLELEELIKMPPPEENGPWPLVTVAVCTRDRAEDLPVCLESLKKLDYSNLDLLLVDNAPQSDQTEKLLKEHYRPMRYVCEPRPGLDWARNRAITEARGEIIAFTDDDVVVDQQWVRAMARVFKENPAVMAVTGLVVPHELETKAQLLFEMNGGFGRGFKRKWYHLDGGRERGIPVHIGAGIFGTGANMAYRRNLFEQIGAFDPALDVGTATNGGGDLEMFYRVLQEGYLLVYEPDAIVRHRHRRDYAGLKTQLTNNGIGLYSYFVRSMLAYPGEAVAIIRFGLWWLWKGQIRRLLIGLTRPYHFPLELIVAEFRGYFIGCFRYFRARRIAAGIDQKYRQEPQISTRPAKGAHSAGPLRPVAVRTIDLSQKLNALDELQAYRQARVFVNLGGRMLGKVDIPNAGQSVSASRLRDAVVEDLAQALLQPNLQTTKDLIRGQNQTVLRQYLGAVAENSATLPESVSASVVVATLDRPDGLRECLSCLISQKTRRKIEIIVVDNNPASGLTPPVAAEFPGVILVSEARRGLAYARNAGFAASSGDIVIATDDDVTLPSTWFEKIVAPFVEADVMAVTGNVLPLEMETSAQQLFEVYGGLGRGFIRREYDTEWFETFRFGAAHTWEIGATANAAFRAVIFSNSQIGLMDEALGPGMPSGVGEDTYLFYKILKDGYKIVYEPSAYVWHEHRSNLRSLRRQLYNYSKGHVAYHLTTMMCDRDLRAIYHLLLALPKFHVKRTLRRLLGRGNYPLKLILLEIMGNLIGPVALFKSRRRVKREGCSATYLPVSQRLTPTLDQTPNQSS